MCLHCKPGKTKKATRFLHAGQIPGLCVYETMTTWWRNVESKEGGEEQYNKLLRAKGTELFQNEENGSVKKIHMSYRWKLRIFYFLVFALTAHMVSKILWGFSVWKENQASQSWKLLVSSWVALTKQQPPCALFSPSVRVIMLNTLLKLNTASLHHTVKNWDS